MPSRKLALPEAELGEMIREIRGQRVMLDLDLAKVYGVATKVFNQAVKRNKARFPEDFMFRLTRDEAEGVLRSRSQNVTLKRGQNIKYLPYVFTEYGALMAANILNSPRAVEMSIFVVRAFARMRETLRAAPDLARKLAALEKELTGRLDVHETAIVGVLQKIMKILNPPPGPPPPAKPRIGFTP
ncbi:MAG: ORF6N domain-containing protein [Chthoniobacterales bacterium]